MPIAGPILGAQIAAKFATSGFTGAQTVTFSMALGNGIITNILATNIFSGTTVGIGPGPGTGTGKVVGLVGPIVGQNIYTMMVAKGFTGAQTLTTAMAIGSAFAEHITLMGIVTSVGGPVAIGSGIGPIVGIVGATLGASIFQMLSASGFTGAQTLSTAMAVGDGIALSMSTAIVNTVIVGVPAPPLLGPIPVAGIETGKLI
jgi:hypothetical protein